MALGNAAVHQEIDAAGFRMGLGLDQAAGAGDAVYGADVGDFYYISLETIWWAVRATL